MNIVDPRAQATFEAIVANLPVDLMGARMKQYARIWTSAALTAADAVDPLRQSGVVVVDTNDEALKDRVADWITDGSGTDLAWRFEVGLVFAAVAALARREEQLREAGAE